MGHPNTKAFSLDHKSEESTAPSPATRLLELKGVECRYGGNTAVHDLSLHINQGAMACLLGPSGCGKSTILRAIAGLEPITKGEIALAGKTISIAGYTLAPEKRRVGMVFQDYALFPHMNVRENVSFGIRGVGKQERRRQAEGLLETVGLAAFADRYPHELSGGQQQRVALARALATKPAIMLLDEPFSNLDVDMRERLSLEVRDILKRQGITGILVTHDQHEAFAVSDVIGVLHQGRLQQWDTAYNLYHDPANRFVADFIGQGVFLPGTLRSPDTVELEIGVIKGDRAYHLPLGTQVDVLVRPDDVIPDDASPLKGQVIHKAFKGAETICTLLLPTGGKILSAFPSHHNCPVGESVGIRFDLQHFIAFER